MGFTAMIGDIFYSPFGWAKKIAYHVYIRRVPSKAASEGQCVISHIGVNIQADRQQV